MLDLNQGIFKPSQHCLPGRKPFVQSEAKMRLVLLGLVGATLVLGTPARARLSLVRAQYGGARTAATNCGFVSFAQCMATVSGIGGSSVQNTMYQPPAPKARKKNY
jgi:hypothetical protein